METLRVAAATDDGRSFVDRHFGDAAFYDVYEVTREGWARVHRVANGTAEETGHADPVKARGVAGVLQAQGVQVALTLGFGPNLKRIKSKFVCIMTGQHDVTAGLVQVQRNFEVVAREWGKGEERDFLDLRRP